ncbi:hypothetical protein FNF29_01817 [Cafeteria roenbergensis]|uniref:AB hydrolase-1 domain-containing protein n=1 Tax=Cafeteria roenbergensis TaxID=33653 RepID=A0A5A8CQR9_CAFRO|nr:hypothetical protein FNF29_01817 [Cafeteria roenbergensis]|eukprot:KAA0155442.1 hypothetical protein FNF29_01817 [Cafeteria roenbergensis]
MASQPAPGVLRTPESAFAGLVPGAGDPSFAHVGGAVTAAFQDRLSAGDRPALAAFPADGPRVRMAYIDEGKRSSGECILLLHGEPSWSFLYRKMVAPLVARGFRVVAPDLIGFGRSDKPGRREDYTYDRMVGWLAELVFDVLGLGRKAAGQRLTLVCQDWGGLLGLRLVAARPHRFARVVTANTFLPTGAAKMPAAFRRWVEFSQTAPDLPVGGIVSGGCETPLSDEAIAAYDAPFEGCDESWGAAAAGTRGAQEPPLDAKAGVRVLPALVPTEPDSVDAVTNRACWRVLATYRRPWLCAFSDGDPITAGADLVIREAVPGCRAAGVHHCTIRGGGHFLQEDRGEELAAAVASFVEETASVSAHLVDGQARLTGPLAAEALARADAALAGHGRTSRL